LVLVLFLKGTYDKRDENENESQQGPLVEITACGSSFGIIFECS